MALEGVPDEGTLAHGLHWGRMQALPPGLGKVAHYLVCGLLIDGVHHKQWCVEQALAALGIDLSKLAEQLRGYGCPYEEGTAP